MKDLWVSLKELDNKNTSFDASLIKVPPEILIDLTKLLFPFPIYSYITWLFLLFILPLEISNSILPA